MNVNEPIKNEQLKEDLIGRLRIDKKFLMNFIDMVEIATIVSRLSNAKKRKVGAIITDDEFNVISTGFNYRKDSLGFCENLNNETFEDVFHAEATAIMNMFKTTGSNYNNITKYLFCTYSPCMDCSKLIVQSGISVLIYDDEHKSNFKEPSILGGISPKDFLELNGVVVLRYKNFLLENKII